MKDKFFDCVEMMHKGQAAVKKRLESLSHEEQLAYWKRRREELQQKQEQVRAERVTHAPES